MLKRVLNLTGLMRTKFVLESLEHVTFFTWEGSFNHLPSTDIKQNLHPLRCWICLDNRPQTALIK